MIKDIETLNEMIRGISMDLIMDCTNVKQQYFAMITCNPMVFIIRHSLVNLMCPIFILALLNSHQFHFYSNSYNYDIVTKFEAINFKGLRVSGVASANLMWQIYGLQSSSLLH